MAITKVQTLKNKKEEIAKGVATNAKLSEATAKAKTKKAPEPEPEVEEEPAIVLEAPEGPLSEFISDEIQEYDLDSLVIVTDDDDPLKENRAELVLTQEFINSLRDDGQIEPGLVYALLDEDGEPTGKHAIVSGVQRYKGLKMLADSGVKGIVFKAREISSEAGDMGAILTGVLVNELRTNDSPQARARNMARVTKYNGGNYSAAARVFGVSPETVRLQVKLYETADPAVFKALEDGIIKPTLASRLATQAPKEQKEAIKKARELSKELGEARVITRNTKHKAGQAVAVTESQLLEATNKRKAKPSGKLLTEISVHPETPKDVATILAWVLGELSNEDLIAKYKFLQRNWKNYENAPQLEVEDDE